MDEGSDSRVWDSIKRLFSRKTDCQVEEAIMEAKDDGEIATNEASMMLNILELADKQAYEIMTPRTDIVCVEIDETIPDIARKVFESGHSRLPVYRETKDQIIGILHCKELLRFFVETPEATPSLESILRPPHFIPETKNVRDILLDLQAHKQHMAIVLDEYGGTAGLITLEDVLEEIVGDIEDEYDPPRPEEIQLLEDGAFLVAGRATLEDFIEKTGIPVSSEEVETVGGYVTEHLGRVPATGEICQIEGVEFTVKEADAKQIHWLVVSPRP